MRKAVLRRQNPLQPPPSAMRNPMTVLAPAKLRDFFAKKNIKATELALLTRQLCALLRAGVPLIQAFELLAGSASNPSMRELVQALQQDIASGTAMHAAFRKHPEHFSALYCSLLAAGEEAGILDSLLEKLADTLEANEAMKARVRSALLYPATVLTVASAVVGVIMVWVVPVFQDVFKSMGAALPLPTLVVVALSAFLTEWAWAMVLVAIVFLGLGLQVLQRHLWAQLALEQWQRRLPVVGAMLRASTSVRFAQTLAALLQAGIPLAEALQPVASACGSRLLEQASSTMVRQIQQGSSLSQAMSKSNLFPHLMLQMCAIGEETGTLEALLSKSANLLETQVNQWVNNLASMLEPAIMVILGVVVGGILVAMYLPIFKLGQVF